MTGLIGIVAMLTVIALSLAMTRLAAIALTLTGLSEEAARFQARSAFTGTGFTTSEAEAVVSHPVRRKIIMMLMIVRSAGIVTIIISLVLSFADQPEAERMNRLALLVAGIAVLWGVALSRTVNRLLSRTMEAALRKWTRLDARDYASLLRLTGEYMVTEMRLEEGDWLAGKTIAECQLNKEGINILGILRRDGSYVGVPKSGTKLFPDDTLIVYGRAKAIEGLDRRRAGHTGDHAHEKAVTEQASAFSRQDRLEVAHLRRRQAEDEAEQARREKEESGEA